MLINRKGTITELKDYIIKNLKKGYTKESLKWALVNQGYSKLEVEKSIREAEEELAAKAPVLKTKPKITHEIISDNEFSPREIEKKSFLKKLFG